MIIDEIYQMLYSNFVNFIVEKIEKTGYQEIKSILSSLGEWPVVVGRSWIESNFNWQTLIYQLRKIGHTTAMNSLINFNILIDEKNSKRRIIIVS